jgi:hypothetical protein
MSARAFSLSRGSGILRPQALGLCWQLLRISEPQEILQAPAKWAGWEAAGQPSSFTLGENRRA